MELLHPGTHDGTYERTVVRRLNGGERHHGFTIGHDPFARQSHGSMVKIAAMSAASDLPVDGSFYLRYRFVK
ncbi:hypothetical protein [Spongiactinospora sp. TRM90649]|uniref:hypothetical protein n=1 Tax=Spongiactinospora sp. TRM90649 TaxID=3031114 RepID=UPI0023F77F59|nr:hypothetical protein [Spongiactinospora sp. TRM90649]